MTIKWLSHPTLAYNCVVFLLTQPQVANHQQQIKTTHLLYLQNVFHCENSFLQIFIFTVLSGWELLKNPKKLKCGFKTNPFGSRSKRQIQSTNLYFTTPLNGVISYFYQLPNLTKPNPLDQMSPMGHTYQRFFKGKQCSNHKS